jgi:C1A family cysteine protease
LGRYATIAGKVRHISGWKRDTPDHRDYRVPTPAAAPPAKIDLRDQGPPVGDQGTLGSCSANAGCEALEFLEKQGIADKLFSRLFLYFYARKEEGTPPAEDSGAQIRSVMKVLAETGVAYEVTWPYADAEARFSVEPTTAAQTEAGQHKVLYYYRCSNLAAVKASLADGYPVAFGFSMPDNMMSDQCGKDGLVHYPEPNEGYQGCHSVLAVGYDDAQAIGKEQGAVLAQNSWGTNWGLQGYFWLPYSFFTNADPNYPGTTLADDCWTIRKAAL